MLATQLNRLNDRTGLPCQFLVSDGTSFDLFGRPVLTSVLAHRSKTLRVYGQSDKHDYACKEMRERKQGYTWAVLFMPHAGVSTVAPNTFSGATLRLPFMLGLYPRFHNVNCAYKESSNSLSIAKAPRHVNIFAGSALLDRRAPHLRGFLPRVQ